MEGYRFFLDHEASTPEHLAWSDKVEKGEATAQACFVRRYGRSITSIRDEGP
jgi:hypothetical protein